jgi:hypothetical protein
MKGIIVGCALMLAGVCADASASDASNCAEIKQSAKRLACFDAQAKQPTPIRVQPEVKTAVGSILKTLRKMDSATSIGINMRDYAALVRDSSADIDEELRSVPDGDFKDAALQAKQAYIDANTLWSSSFTLEFRSLWLEHSDSLLKKYSINAFLFEAGAGNSFAKTYDMDKTAFLSPIWAKAKSLTEKADALSSTPAKKSAIQQAPLPTVSGVKHEVEPQQQKITSPTGFPLSDLSPPTTMIVEKDFTGGTYSEANYSSARWPGSIAGTKVGIYESRDGWARVTPKDATEQWLPINRLSNPD